MDMYAHFVNSQLDVMFNFSLCKIIITDLINGKHSYMHDPYNSSSR